MKNKKTWEERVQAYEEEGCTRSDAQGIVDAEYIKEGKRKIGTTGHWCCGEPMEIAGQTPDGFDKFECNLCGSEE